MKQSRKSEEPVELVLYASMRINLPLSQFLGELLDDVLKRAGPHAGTSSTRSEKYIL